MSLHHRAHIANLLVVDRVSNQASLPFRAACIHGRYEDCGKPLYDPNNGFPLGESCPGGQEVIDADILDLAADIIETNPVAGAIFAAAIGDTE